MLREVEIDFASFSKSINGHMRLVATVALGGGLVVGSGALLVGG